MIPKALFLSFFALQLPAQQSRSTLRRGPIDGVARDVVRHNVIGSPYSEAVSTDLASDVARAVRGDAALARSVVQPQDNRSDKDGVAFEIVQLNRTYILFDELDAGVWDPKRALNDGEVQFAAGSSNSLRIYDTRRDFPDYSSGGAAVRALGTTTPQAHPSLGVHFRKGAVPNVAVAAVFLVDGRPAPVTWVLEAFRGGRIVGRWRPERLITSLRASTGVVAVDEVRILGTNAPADGSGLILLTDLSYDSADIKTEEVARRE